MQYSYENLNCSVGGNDYLVDKLRLAMEKAEKVDIYITKMFIQSAFFKITRERAGSSVILNRLLVTF